MLVFYKRSDEHWSHELRNLDTFMPFFADIRQNFETEYVVADCFSHVGENFSQRQFIDLEALAAV